MFDPLWLRMLIVAVPLLMSAYEFATGSVFWGVLFGGVGGYMFHLFFLARVDRS
ncbi:MAG: hypothetical protein Q4G22_04915 [Paracoccus sp. (in: a-proteobacteria)]|uniref:hypothetical protein n=1 Tax=Paracoccus sp. TaxID=267 RepID=UPI0026DFD59D|nr:hypothetical protein [Paracoccus sp. (in: a-proteobacteria)]MDO5631161.1 hypothetical protein [Paracoccus sp. (in: a-proteobacteria)]